MKKNLFVTLLPIFLLISGCSTPKECEKDTLNNIKEEVDFDDSTFLDAPINFLDPQEEPVSVSDVPSIGIQSAPGANNTVSIRFVGAVRITGDWQDPNLVITWNRAAYKEDGSAQLSEATKIATKKYSAINAGGNEYTIKQYNQSHNSNYTHFVTYVINDIPNTLTKAFLTASLTVDTGETVTTSKAVATSVDLTTQFSFESDLNEPFIVKKRGDGSFKTFKTNISYIVNDNQQYDPELTVGLHISNSETEEFIAVIKGDNTFKILGSSLLNSSGSYFTQVGNSLFFKWTSSNITSGDGINVSIRYRQSVNQVFVKFGAQAKRLQLTIDDAWKNNATRFVAIFACVLDRNFNKTTASYYVDLQPTDDPYIYSTFTYFPGNFGYQNDGVTNVAFKAFKADGTEYSASVNNNSNIFLKKHENDDIIEGKNNMYNTLTNSSLMNPVPLEFDYDVNTAKWLLKGYGDFYFED